MKAVDNQRIQNTNTYATSKVRFGRLPSNTGVTRRLIWKEKGLYLKVASLGELETPWLQPNLFCKTQKMPRHSQSWSKWPDTPLQSYLSFWGPRLFQEGVFGFRLSLPGLHTCGDSTAIASLQRLFSPRKGPGLLSDHNRQLC